MKEALKDEVKDVVLSTRLVDSPVCLVSGDGISFEMEKVIDAMPTNDKIKADRILEVNPNHDLFKALSKVYSEDPSEIKEYAKLLYNQALLMEGFKLPNNVEFSNMMCKLMIKSAKLMEENDVLYRLKELEMLERIFDKVGNINVDGGNFIESLENIVGTRRKEK